MRPMSYDKATYEEVEAVGGGLHFLRDPLNCEHLGVSVLAVDPGWEGKPHDHGDDDHEEVYVLVEGEATVTVEGEAVEMQSGDALRVDPDSERQIENGDAESTFVLAGAP
jgi:mannose-6-phosphate isomerase-like protein (cupin superfamily)